MNDTESSALTRAICDKSLPRPLRAGMLREINNAGKGLGIVNKPFGLTFFAGPRIRFSETSVISSSRKVTQSLSPFFAMHSSQVQLVKKKSSRINSS